MDIQKVKSLSKYRTIVERRQILFNSITWNFVKDKKNLSEYIRKLIMDDMDKVKRGRPLMKQYV